MAYPVINSPMFPSVADAGFLPPKLREMPVFNPGTHYYLCEDGITRLLTEEQAINIGISCKALGKTNVPRHQPQMGCCGYDEIERKPQSTSPVYGLKAAAINIEKKVDGPMRTRRISFMGTSTYHISNRGFE